MSLKNPVTPPGIDPALTTTSPQVPQQPCTLWISKATNAHLEYAVLTAFPRQQCSHERSSMLRLCAGTLSVLFLCAMTGGPPLISKLPVWLAYCSSLILVVQTIAVSDISLA